ncbi:TonB-dependent receptor [Segetibacter sp. 3557_3]|uniref:SusC/RagA family TonB-linked outer membrane protein n=1 Tax=Segetibacter sp. 3557_3 TaxID=2547429 RepID=UPI0010586C1B|nr:TonB-dependent receptor [Segetibacter sp. 3557_3]TDH28630.1 TonB-dependent receptor [Segetibacter sp. 3557_3]
MKLKRPLLAIFLLLVSGMLFAQTKQITGKVLDNKGQPLPGVSILTDQKSSSAITQGDGTFTIRVNNKTSTLVVSYVGFTTQTIPIGGRSTIDVTLQPAQSTLDDVVVVGYGTQRKSHVTGSVSKYSNDRMDEAPVARLDQALQGKIAGVQIQNTTSEAGANPRIRVRGLSSINAGSDPLVVVDGHPVPDGLAFVNMADVESVEVLKDAASAAIYGSRGASGVILVTTKSAKTDRTRYGVKISSGVKTAYKTQDMMTVSDYVSLLFNEAALRADDPSVPATQKNRITAQERAQYVIENTIMGGVPTDWQKEALRTANVTNVQMNVSGGRSNIKYFISGGYNKDDGLMYHSSYDKLSLRAKMETELGKRVKLNLNINPTYTKRERPAVGYIDFVRFPSFMPARHTDASAAFVNSPNIRPGDWAQVGHFNGRVYSGLMPDGSTWTNTAATDPFASSNNNPKSVMETRDINTDEYRVLSSGDLTFNLAKGLDLKTTGSVYVTYADGLDYAQTNNNRQGDINRGIYTNRLFVDLLSENTLNYVKRVGDHSFTALAGFTAQKTNIKSVRTEATNFPSDNIRTLNTALQIVQPSVDASGNQQGTYTLQNNIGLISYLGRATYSFKDRYLFSASFRRDGSSYFAPGNKWGNFPSVSAGWVVSKENFMRDIDWLSQLKLRASYGATGNNRIVDFAFVDLLYASSYAYGSGTGTVASGQLPSREILANPNITWERTFQYNYGADLSILNNAVSLSAEVYQSKTDRLLLRQAVMGFTGANQAWNNIGRIQNNGIEFELTSNNFRRSNFRWTTTANLARNRNKLLEFGGEAFQLSTGERNEAYSTAVGFPSIRFWGYKTDGVWLSQADADAARAKDKGTANPAVYFTAGGIKLQDLNNDGKIDPADRTNIGSPFPEFTFGLNNSFNYKNFDLSFLIQGVQGVDVINGDAFYNESRKYNRKYNNGNRWVSALAPGDGKTPYFTSGFDWMLTDYVVEDGSYIALREIIFGYKLPESLSKAARLSSARLYCSVQNAYMRWANNYRGINPEARNTSGNYATPLIDGYQRGGFPMPRTILFGLDINF